MKLNINIIFVATASVVIFALVASINFFLFFGGSGISDYMILFLILSLFPMLFFLKRWKYRFILPLIFSSGMGIIQSLRISPFSYSISDIFTYLYQYDLIPVVLLTIGINFILSFILLVIYIYFLKRVLN